MLKHKELEKAKNFVKYIDRKGNIDIVALSRHLKSSAEFGDKKTFDELIILYDNFCDRKNISQRLTMCFLEWVCAGIDNGFENILGFSVINYDSTFLHPVGRTQEIFNNLYGEFLIYKGTIFSRESAGLYN